MSLDNTSHPGRPVPDELTAIFVTCVKKAKGDFGRMKDEG
jgi:hypothetical protein